MSLAVKFSTIAEMFDNIVERFLSDSRPMLMYKSGGTYRGVSFLEMKRMVEDLLLGFSQLGVTRGDTVALISENRPEWVIADMSIIHLGAVSVPLYPTMTAKQIEFVLRDAGVKFAVVSNQMQLVKMLKIIEEVKSLQKIIVFNEKSVIEHEKVILFSDVISKGRKEKNDRVSLLQEYTKKLAPEDVLTIIYTSGTTGNPKGVMLTHKNVASNIQSATACLPISPEDILLSFLPLCHSFERTGGYYAALACGATVAYAESIDTVRENLLEIRPTIMTCVPRFFERIHNRIQKQVADQSPLKQKIFQWAMVTGKLFARATKNGTSSPLLRLKHFIAEKLVFHKLKERTGGRIKYFVSGGAALSRELGEFFEAIGLLVIEGYGLSESSPVISVNRLEQYKFGSVGQPISGVEVKIAADGEILARGPNIMQGYWNNPQATREVIDDQGWLHTGDIGLLDGDGFLHITDRKKHLFVSSGGKNIAPQPIENLFLQSKYIDQFVLIGDGRMYLTALIVPDADLLKEKAKGFHLSYSNLKELTERSEVQKLFSDEIEMLQRDLPNYERVRRFTLLESPLTIENGEITPTMKIKRKIVEEKYKHLIDKMYEGVK